MLLFSKNSCKAQDARFKFLEKRGKMDSHFHGNDIKSNEIAALAFSKFVMTEGWVLTNLFLGEFREKDKGTFRLSYFKNIYLPY